MASQLDPSIILKAGNFSTPDYAKTMELRDLVQGRHAAAAEQQRLRDVAAATQQRTAAVGGMAASGDFAGAQKTALGAGDFDLASKVSGLDEKQKAQALEKVGAGLPVFAAALKLPPEQRKAAILAALPSLAVHGYTPEMLAAVDTSDAGLTGQIASGMKLSDVLKQQQDDRKFAYDKAHDAEQLGVTREGNYLSAGLLPPGDQGTVPAMGNTPTGNIVAAMIPITIKSESAGNANAVSPKGARGLMQVMPGTNTDPGFGVRPAADGSEAERTRVGQEYLGAMMERYGNDPAKAWAAYNAGPGRVDAALANGKGNWLAMLPAETRSYVRNNVAQLSGGGGQRADGLRIIPGGKLDKSVRKDAPAGYRWTGDGNLEPIPGGPGDKQGRQANLKPPPVKALDGYNNNRTALRKLDQAVAAINAYPEAVGFIQGMTPNVISSRTDPKGVSARALIADIGSLKIHDRSGAAVTAAETPRLIPFIPQISDDAKTVKTKLANFQTELQSMQADIEDSYSEAQGYKFPTYRNQPSRLSGTLKPNNAAGGIPTFTPEQARNAPKGTRFRTSDGREMVRQ